MTDSPTPAPYDPLPPHDLRQPPPISGWAIAWLAAMVGWLSLIAFTGLYGGADFEPTDAWVAQTAREMSESKDWTGYVVPHFSGELRLQKSPGAYWAACLVAWIRGTPIDEAAVRIPNGFAALLTVVSVFWLARRIAGDRAAVFAGFAAAASGVLLYWTHRGASDLGTASLMAASLACLWIALESEPRGWRQTLILLAGYLFAGLSMLYKMPMPLACVGIPVLAYLLIGRRWSVLKDWRHLAGLVLFLVPWLPWLIAFNTLESGAAAAGGGVDLWTTLQKWRAEYWDRITGALPSVEDQAGDWQMYFLYIGVAFVFAVPFSLSIPGALVRGFRRSGEVDRRGQLFVTLWFLSLFAFFTAAAGKETRYLLPVMPPLFVLLGIELAAFFDPKGWRNPRLERIGAIAATVLTLVGAVAGFFVVRRFIGRHAEAMSFAWDQLALPLVVTLAIFSAGIVASAWLYAGGRRSASFGALVAMMWAGWLWVRPALMPIIGASPAFTDFGHQLRDRVPVEMRGSIFQVAQQDPRITWHSDVRFPRIVDQIELLKKQGGARTRAAEERIVAEAMIERLRGDAPVLLVCDPLSFVRFHSAEAADAMRAERVYRPKTYLWLVARTGRLDHRFVLFSNKPPPWPEPALPFPAESLTKNGFSMEAVSPEGPGASMPAPSSASAPASQAAGGRP
ncbi:MAG: hypothetical protein AMXMBFR47_40400 [Planctomycetota bacterium]